MKVPNLLFPVAELPMWVIVPVEKKVKERFSDAKNLTRNDEKAFKKKKKIGGSRT